jgi:undecaprenyl-diphosphatase
VHTVLSVAPLAWDRHLEGWIAAHRVSWLNGFFELLSRIGTLGLVWLAIALVLAVVWRWPRLFVVVLAADGAADLSAGILKLLIPRHRPRVHPLVTRPHDHSFPSGHAATSFACATVLAYASPRLRVPVYLLAALIGFSRVYVGVHYPLDVIGGAVLGVAIGAAVARALRLRAGRRRGSRRGPRRG